jgi:hypothetical protein
LSGRLQPQSEVSRAKRVVCGRCRSELCPRRGKRRPNPQAGATHRHLGTTGSGRKPAGPPPCPCTARSIPRHCRRWSAATGSQTPVLRRWRELRSRTELLRAYVPWSCFTSLPGVAYMPGGTLYLLLNARILREGAYRPQRCRTVSPLSASSALPPTRVRRRVRPSIQVGRRAVNARPVAPEGLAPMQREGYPPLQRLSSAPYRERSANMEDQGPPSRNGSR